VKSVASCSRYIPTRVTDDQSRTAQKPRPLKVLEEFHQEYGFKVSLDLEQAKRRELLQLLYDYREVFARSLTEIKRYPGYELEIELLSNRKVFKRNYRLLPQDAEIAKKQITEMLDAGVIEPSTCADENSPIFLVNKKDGSKRFVLTSDNLIQ